MPNTVDEVDNAAAQRALQIAFQTMQERCHQLENRLAAVEEQNIRLRFARSPDERTNICHQDNDVPPTIESLQDRIEELMKQKSQLTHHVLMVAAENRQLWNRLTRLTRTNRCLGTKLIKISDTLKQNSTTRAIDPKNNTVENPTHEHDINNVPSYLDNKDISLEEISLRLINSIMMEKSELEQQCSEMMQLQNVTDVDLITVGFTYPDDTNTNYLEQLEEHEARLCRTKHTLRLQQAKLQVLINLKNVKKVHEKVCQTGTQSNNDDSRKEYDATQTSSLLSTTSQPSMKRSQVNTNDEVPGEKQTCPICGIFFDTSITFHSFHEHVCSHFTTEVTVKSE